MLLINIINNKKITRRLKIFINILLNLIELLKENKQKIIEDVNKIFR